MFKRSLATIAALLTVIAAISVGSSRSLAQETTPPRLAFEHDGQGVTGFALYAQPEKGKAIRIDLGLVLADGNGLRTAALPSLPDGAYALSIAAYNAAGESPRIAAAPGRVVVKSQSTAASSSVASTEPPQATQAATPAPTAVSPPQKNGALGRFWKILVGED